MEVRVNTDGERAYLDLMEKALMLQLEGVQKRRQALAVAEAEAETMAPVAEMALLKEATEQTGVPRAALLQLVKSGTVAGCRLGPGGSWLINMGQLRKFLAGAAAGTTTAGR